jgi:hypothetical protein
VDTQAQIESNAVCLPKTPPPADPFDPQSCTGPAMSMAEALAYLAPGSMVTPIAGSTLQIAQRTRHCVGLPGAGLSCAAWQTLPTDQTGYPTELYEFNGETANNPIAPTGGSVGVRIGTVTNPTGSLYTGEIDLDYKVVGGPPDYVPCKYVGDPATVQCGVYDSTWGQTGYGNLRLVGVPPYLVGTPTVTTSCIRLQLGMSLLDGDEMDDYEVVFYGTYPPSSQGASSEAGPPKMSQSSSKKN